MGNLENGRLSPSRLLSYIMDGSAIIKGFEDHEAFKKLIVSMTFFKRISDVFEEERQKIVDEEGEIFAKRPEFYPIYIPDNSGWNEVKRIKEGLSKTLMEALGKIEQNDRCLFDLSIFYDWLSNEIWLDNFIYRMMERLSKVELTNSAIGVKDFSIVFNELIYRIESSIRTPYYKTKVPRSVNRLIAGLLDPKKGETIYDPSFGAGGVLLEVANHLHQKCESFETISYFGEEVSYKHFGLGLMNLTVRGVDTYNLERSNPVYNPKFLFKNDLMGFDCVASNLLSNQGHWRSAEWDADPFERNFVGKPSDSSSIMAWILHMIKSMSDNGRMVVLFHSYLLYKDGDEGKILRQLIKLDLLEAVIELGDNLMEGEEFKLCLLIFKRHKPKSRKNKVLFIDATELVIKGRRTNHLDDSHVDQICKWYSAFESVNNKVKAASLMEIEYNNFILMPSKYLIKSDKERLINYCESMGLCPIGTKWMELYELLPNKRKKGNEHIPPLPLVLSGWLYSSLLQKIDRFRGHIDWADKNGALDRIADFLYSLDEDDWYNE